MRESPEKRSETTSARKWSPVPVKSSTEAVDPGRAPSIRSLSCSAVGIAIKTIAALDAARLESDGHSHRHRGQEGKRVPRLAGTARGGPPRGRQGRRLLRLPVSA